MTRKQQWLMDDPVEEMYNPARNRPQNKVIDLKKPQCIINEGKIIGNEPVLRRIKDNNLGMMEENK